jgi:hypothetical protein
VSLLRTTLGRAPQPPAPSRVQTVDRPAAVGGFAAALGHARDGVEAADRVRAAVDPSPSWHRDRPAPDAPATAAKDDRHADDASPAGSRETRAAPQTAAGAGTSLPALAASALREAGAALPLLQQSAAAPMAIINVARDSEGGGGQGSAAAGSGIEPEPGAGPEPGSAETGPKPKADRARAGERGDCRRHARMGRPARLGLCGPRSRCRRAIRSDRPTRRRAAVGTSRPAPGTPSA